MSRLPRSKPIVVPSRRVKVRSSPATSRAVVTPRPSEPLIWESRVAVVMVAADGSVERRVSVIAAMPGPTRLKVASAEAGLVRSVATRLLDSIASVSWPGVVTRSIRSCTVAVPPVRSRVSRSKPSVVPSRRVKARSSPGIRAAVGSPVPPLISERSEAAVIGVTLAEEVMPTPAVMSRLPVRSIVAEPSEAKESGSPAGAIEDASNDSVAVST